MQELAVLVSLRVEKDSEVVKDVIEQVVHDDAAFDRARQRIYEIIVFVDLFEAIVIP